MWEIVKYTEEEIKLDAPVFIEGLPGIGNVGKVAVDYIIEDLKAEKLFDIYSNTYPHSVFVNEENLIELPTISIFHKNVKGKDYLFLAGDVQPTDEGASYDFCNMIIDMLSKYNSEELITLGGIAFTDEPRTPKVYCTGNSPELIERYKKDTEIDTNLYGVVGPIIGVSGLLLGLARRRQIRAITLLAETMGHPLYLGMNGAKELLHIIEKKLQLGINLEGFDEEVKAMEDDLVKKPAEFEEVMKQAKIKKLKETIGQDMSYIG